MKKFMFVLTLLTGWSFNAGAHVTKAEIEAMMVEIGTTIDQMEEFYVYNVWSYYSDGSTDLSYDKYTKEKGNHASLTETGIKLTYKPDGVMTSVFLLPYSSIISINVGKNFIGISLIQ